MCIYIYNYYIHIFPWISESQSTRGTPEDAVDMDNVTYNIWPHDVVRSGLILSWI